MPSRLLSASILCAVTTQTELPSTTEVAVLLNRGIHELEVGQIGEAQHLLFEALEQDEAGGGTYEHEISFQLGLALKRQADRLDEPLRGEKLREALAFYERAVALRPKRAAAQNNLAELYSDLGRYGEAAAAFEAAVQSENPLRPFYHRNYADFLAQQGEWTSAAAHYRRSLEGNPDDRLAHERITVILSLHFPSTLPEYLCFLIERGQAPWAEEVVLDRMKNESSELGEKDLTILAAARAQAPHLPEELAAGRVVEVLGSLKGRVDIGEGVREFLSLHDGRDLKPASYRWWGDRGRALDISGRLLSPRQSFRHLIRSLGEGLLGERKYDTAWRYFLLAVDLSREEPDLEAFSWLIDLPAVRERLEAVHEVAIWNESLLGRRGAVQPDDVYFYRHNLGLVYAFLGHWGDGRSPASAIYQLKRATRITGAGGVGPPDGPPDTPTFDARIYSYLAKGYVETDKPGKAKDTLYDLVDAYRAQKLDAEAAALEAMLGRRRRPPSGRVPDAFDDPPLLPPDFDPRVEPPKPPGTE